MLAIFAATFLGARLSPLLTTRVMPPPPLEASVAWSLMSAADIRNELQLYGLSPPEWVEDSESYYMAKCDDVPAAFFSFSDRYRGRPIVNICSMNRDLMTPYAWRVFEWKYKVVPIFTPATMYVCNTRAGDEEEGGAL